MELEVPQTWKPRPKRRAWQGPSYQVVGRAQPISLQPAQPTLQVTKLMAKIPRPQALQEMRLGPDEANLPTFTWEWGKVVRTSPPLYRHREVPGLRGRVKLCRGLLNSC